MKINKIIKKLFNKVPNSKLGENIDNMSNEINSLPAYDKVKSIPEGVKNQIYDNKIKKNTSDEALAQGKQHIYNLIIVDESGSMGHLRDVTLSGVNETITTIKQVQKEFEETQQHFLSLVTFDERRGSLPSVRTIFDAIGIGEIQEFNDYNPTGATPLYDAMGESLTKLCEKIKDNENATGVVTILTDGLENFSTKWRAEALRNLIERLKEMGWVFSYMGSAHDVKEVTDLLSIDNVMEFSHDMTGASSTWGRDRSSKREYFRKMNMCYAEERELDIEEKRRRYKQRATEYYGERVTPGMIRTLEPNEVFVFGSNSAGQHGGGAAMTAMRFFGAEWGKGEGIQGQSYAIPTMEGLEHTKEAVHRFCIYARENPDKRFLVTQIGCGIAGYSPRDIAPMFKEAIEIENVALPKEFWEVLGLRMSNML